VAGAHEGFWVCHRMALLSLAARGNHSYPDFWVVTGGPRYPGYKTPINPLAGLTIPQISAQARGPLAATAHEAGCGPS
jgi:hypothetical protein